MMEKRLARVIFAVLTVFCAMIFASFAAEPVETVKIGLKYGSDALPAAKLQNLTGLDVGYDFGYFDGDRVFNKLFEVTEYAEIAVLKNKGMWVNANNDYFDSKPENYVYSIGCYHLQADTEFENAESAAEYASRLRELGFNAYVAYINSRYVLRVGEFLSEELASQKLQSVAQTTELSYKIVKPSATCYTVTVTGTDRIIYQFDSNSTPLGIMPKSEKTWFSKIKYYGGFEYTRFNGNDLTVVNVLPVDDYIKGVIPYEVSPSWPIEAQKAQALCAKCYVAKNRNKHGAQGFDVCNTTDCQVYYGTNSATEVSDGVVDSLKGLYITYNGVVCDTYYHASSGGYTEDVENIWGKDVPYLRAVEDKYLEHMLPYSFTVSLETISAILKSKEYSDQNVTDYYVSKRSEAGNVIEIAFTQANGKKLALTGDRSRTAINSTNYGISVKSHRYNVNPVAGFFINKKVKDRNLAEVYVLNKNGEAVSINQQAGGLYAQTSKGIKSVVPTGLVYEVSGTGSGHNIGMCQWGAHDMAEKGFSCEEIIKFYYTGVEIENLAD